jgi:hypothetical protein
VQPRQQANDTREPGAERRGVTGTGIVMIRAVCPTDMAQEGRSVDPKRSASLFEERVLGGVVGPSASARS